MRVEDGCKCRCGLGSDADVEVDGRRRCGVGGDVGVGRGREQGEAVPRGSEGVVGRTGLSEGELGDGILPREGLVLLILLLQWWSLSVSGLALRLAMGSRAVCCGEDANWG